MLEELQLPLERRMKLYCYNKYAISIADNSAQHYITEHVEIDGHFIKEKARKWHDTHVVSSNHATSC